MLKTLTPIRRISPSIDPFCLSIVLERFELEKVPYGGRGREDRLATELGGRWRGVRGSHALWVDHRERRRTWGMKDGRPVAVVESEMELVHQVYWWPRLMSFNECESGKLPFYNLQ